MEVNPNKRVELQTLVGKIVANKARYKKVANEINCPWEVIAAIHYRESSLNFNRHLHNGDPLHSRTTRVPKGRPTTGTPPFTWEESAMDALKLKNWNNTIGLEIEALFEKLEAYNGFGYRDYKKINSPYLWSWTNQYTKGKYVADGKYDASFVDGQCGVIPIFFELMKY